MSGPDLAGEDAEAGNLLGRSRSPYLLQHAANPVHWRSWGGPALAEARRRQRPILLSVGYAACHWCHVMAHESFEDPETAAVMNRLFVNIKVDREERPDVDQVYMAALHALGEQGGWPLTMFLTPEGAPFWGGTYFPPEPRWGRPSFRQVLEGIGAAWAAGDGAVSRNAEALARALERATAATPGGAIGPATLDRVQERLLGLVDWEQGGLRGAPKFPNAPLLRFLWQGAWRRGETNERGGRASLHLMLTRMAAGGIHDHLGGGFARYATDGVWLVPHFEKMLYDNAQLLELLALAASDRPDPALRRAADGIVAWLERDMPAMGAFAASEDADSEGEEGRFYVWTEAEIDSVLGAGAASFKAAYDVTQGGNWEGHTILRRVLPEGGPEREAALGAARETLLARRAARVRPARDDKVLADWNGLAIAGLCRAAAVFGRPDWLALASRTYDAITARMAWRDGRIAHAARDGDVTAAGLLLDQAAMARAALALYEAEAAPEHLARAAALAEAALAWFADGTGGLFASAADAADAPPARPRAAADEAVPAGAGLLAEVLARLYHLTGEVAWRDRASAAIASHSGDEGGLAGMTTLLAAADLLERAAVVVLVGPPGDPALSAMHAIALAHPDPATCVLRVSDTASLPASHPAAGKQGPAGYVCRASVCGLKLRDAAALAEALGVSARPREASA